MKIYQAEITRYLLALAGEDISLEVIIEWTPQQVRKAEAWATRYYVKANDNPSIRVPPKPDFLVCLAAGS